jgi:transcriptional regulator with XRE-family HTH domain
LDPEEPEPVVMAPVAEPRPSNGNGHTHMQVAVAIRSLRQRAGLSQRQLALRMSVPRTYVSKIENDKATPTLSSLERLARALGVGVPELLKGGLRTREEEVLELVADDFIAQIVPFAGKLNGLQWSSLLGQIREMTLRPHRTS